MLSLKMGAFTSSKQVPATITHIKMKTNLQINTEDFTTIPITSYSLEKIKAYSKLAKSSEVYGFLLAPLDDSDGIIRSVILAMGQYASSGGAGIDEIAAGKAKAEIENLGYKPIGFWHSHGSHSVWHSKTDDHNLDTLLGSFAGNNEEKLSKHGKNYSYIDHEKNKIVYRNGPFEIALSLDKSDTSYESRHLGEKYLKLSNDPSIDIVAALTSDFKFLIKDGANIIIAQKPIAIEIRKPNTDEFRAIGVAYSIVANKRGEIYSELALNKWCSFCERDETSISKDVKLRIMDSEKVQLDETQLKKDLEERVISFKSGGKEIGS